MTITEQQIVDSTSDFGDRLANSVLDAVFHRGGAWQLQRIIHVVFKALVVAASLTVLSTASVTLLLVAAGLIEL